MNNVGKRQKQGIEKAKKDRVKYKGRKPNQARHGCNIRLIESGIDTGTESARCSRGTISTKT